VKNHYPVRDISRNQIILG